MSDALDADTASGVADTLIAGTMREAGATFVTINDYFEPWYNYRIEPPNNTVRHDQ